MKEQSPKQLELTRKQKVVRRATRTMLHAPFFREKTVHQDPDGMKRAEDLHREGYGILILLNHPSRRDPMQALETVTKSKEFRNARITGPIAKHQTMHGLVPPFAKWSGVYLHEVVTQQTIDRAQKKGKADGLRVGDGSIAYVRDATKTLHGNVAFLAPQMTRQSTIEYKDQDALSMLVKIASKHNSKIAIHFVGFGYKGRFGLKEVDDYSKRKGLNLFSRYKTVHGPTYTLSEAVEQAGGMDKLDRWSFLELAKVAPKAQLPKADKSAS